MNEIILINLDCKDCNNKEVWSIKEFEFVGDYPIECDKCHNDEILEFKLDCSECNNVEYWCIEEFNWCGDYPIECDKCRHDEMNITLNNK